MKAVSSTLSQLVRRSSRKEAVNPLLSKLQKPKRFDVTHEKKQKMLYTCYVRSEEATLCNQSNSSILVKFCESNYCYWIIKA